MSNFRTIVRETGFLLPPSVDEWLPEKHLARFVVEVVDGLDLRAMSGGYRGSGSASYHPRMLLGLLVYGCATGVFSSPQAGAGDGEIEVVFDRRVGPHGAMYVANRGAPFHPRTSTPYAPSDCPASPPARRSGTRASAFGASATSAMRRISTRKQSVWRGRNASKGFASASPSRATLQP